VFQKDSIESHVKEKLVGFGSHGAAVNTGNISGLAVQLSKFAGRKLYSVHCMPHCMELAISKVNERQYIFLAIDNERQQHLQLLCWFLQKDKQFTDECFLRILDTSCARFVRYNCSC